MPTKQKPPGSSIKVSIRVKNKSDFQAKIWAGASILDASRKIVQNIPQSYIDLKALQEGIVDLNDTIQPYLLGTYKLHVALWDKDPVTPGITLDNRLDYNEEWTLVIAPTKITASIVSVDVF